MRQTFVIHSISFSRYSTLISKVIKYNDITAKCPDITTARKKINNYFNKIHKKRINQRSKIFDLCIIFTKMTPNSLCIKSIVILQLALFCMSLIETNDHLLKLFKFIISLNGT